MLDAQGGCESPNDGLSQASNAHQVTINRPKVTYIPNDPTSPFPSRDSQDDRENIFLAAEREIAKMLAENLLNKFKTTPEYKELAGDMVFETA